MSTAVRRSLEHRHLVTILDDCPDIDWRARKNGLIFASNHRSAGIISVPSRSVRAATITAGAPAEYRANGAVRNVPEWYEAFDIQPDDALYLPPEERVNLW